MGCGVCIWVPAKSGKLRTQRQEKEGQVFLALSIVVYSIYTSSLGIPPRPKTMHLATCKSSTLEVRSPAVGPSARPSLDERAVAGDLDVKELAAAVGPGEAHRGHVSRARGEHRRAGAALGRVESVTVGAADVLVKRPKRVRVSV